MKLTVLTPETRLWEGEVVKIVAEATNGAFGILERHIDIAAPLTPGVLVYEDASGKTGYFGVDDGLLVKCGPDVSVAVRRATVGHSLDQLRRHVQEEFLAIDEQEREARSALYRLEAGVVRRILDLERRT